MQVNDVFARGFTLDILPVPMPSMNRNAEHVKSRGGVPRNRCGGLSSGLGKNKESRFPP
jgi:hypothetical protein